MNLFETFSQWLTLFKHTRNAGLLMCTHRQCGSPTFPPLCTVLFKWDSESHCFLCFAVTFGVVLHETACHGQRRAKSKSKWTSWQTPMVYSYVDSVVLQEQIPKGVAILAIPDVRCSSHCRKQTSKIWVPLSVDLEEKGVESKGHSEPEFRSSVPLYQRKLALELSPRQHLLQQKSSLELPRDHFRSAHWKWFFFAWSQVCQDVRECRPYHLAAEPTRSTLQSNTDPSRCFAHMCSYSCASVLCCFASETR